MAVISLVGAYVRYNLAKKELFASLELQKTKSSLEVAYDQLKGLDQLKTDFFANVSHELRTPLTLSLGPIETLLKKLGAADDKQLLETLHRNQLRLMRLINQLLDFAKLESGREHFAFTRESAGEIVKNVIGSLEEAAKSKKLTLSSRVASSLPQVWVDRHKFEQVLLNLMSNAFKFTPKGGSIEVGAEQRGEEVAFWVRDTGIGIPSDKIHTIFERFAQVDTSQTRKYAGTGIGLSLVKEYVERHGGRIVVDSELGLGSTFTILLRTGKDHLSPGEVIEVGSVRPVHHLEAHQLVDFTTDDDNEEPVREQIAEAEETASEPPTSVGKLRPTELVLRDEDKKRSRVLVVDDMPDMRQYIKSLLEKDYDVILAKNGAEGLDKVRRYQPDLVVSDVMMPVMSGAELCKAMKSDTSMLQQIPIVLVTARAEEQTKLQSLDYGADDYLFKPFLQEELVLRVRNLVLKRRQQRALIAAHRQLREQQMYIESDLKLARDFQQSLMVPLELPTPLVGHAEFRPADQVGGDFYHVMRLGEHRVRVLLADMVDHGVKAALRAASAWPEYTTLPHQAMDPAEVLTRFNDVATSKYPDLSGSMLCMDLEWGGPMGARVVYAHAGDMPITKVGPEGISDAEHAGGFIVGLFPGMRYATRQLMLAPGQRLFVYTDGLFTQPNQKGESLRGEGMRALWQTTANEANVLQATQRVITEFDKFRGAGAQIDDVTVIGLEISPTIN